MSKYDSLKDDSEDVLSTVHKIINALLDITFKYIKILIQIQKN